jgi:copper-binding protein NosD
MLRIRTTAVLAAGAVLGLGCALLPAPVSAAEGSDGAANGRAALIRASEAARRSATAQAARQADLVTEEDERLIGAELAGRPDPKHPAAATLPYRVRSSGIFTLVLTARRTAYTFDELRKLAPQTLLPQGKGGFLLREHILVQAGATLSISPRRPMMIRMSSGPDGFVSLVTEGGRLRLNGTAAAPITFQSWDESHGRPDTKPADGRAYVRASGQFVAEHTAFSQLGFWSGRTGGVALVGSMGPLKQLDAGPAAGAKATKEPVVRRGAGRTEVLPAGKLPSAALDPEGSYASRIADSTLTGNAFGLFITGSSGPTITRSVISKSLMDGLVLHGDVDSASVTDVQVERSGGDGVVVSREVEGSVLTRLLVRENGADGIVLAGRPLASGPSASGADIRPFGNNTLTASKSSGNLRIGVHVIGGTAVRVQGNIVDGGQAGVVVAEGATDIDVDSNRVTSAATNGIQVRESHQVRVTGNVVQDSPTGIHVRNSTARLQQNSTSGVTLHGITFIGRVGGSTAAQNRLAGSGTTAIDVVRADSSKLPALEQNDLAGWSRTVTGDSLVSVLLHPLTVIWILIALLLLAMSRPRRGGLTLPYRTDPLAADRDTGPGPVQPSRAREIPVLTVPERRLQLPESAPAPARVARSTTAPVRVPTAEPAREQVPVAAPTPIRGVGQPVSARSGNAVIDLAIREARLNPAAPRRRRVNGR